MNSNCRCKLCELEVEVTTRHHLIPRTLHANKWFKKRFSREEMQTTVDLCKPCHKMIHQFIPEKEMGRQFFTTDSLKQHPQVAHYLAWYLKRN